MNNKLKKKSPAKGLLSVIAKIAPALKTFAVANPAIAAGLVVGGIYLHNKNKKKNRQQQGKLSDAEGKFDARMQDYEDLQFKPIDPSLAEQENVFEDMEVDTTAFEMQRKAFAQSQANILQGLQGVAGGSGAASLAQALSIQSQQATEQMGATVGQMMTRNRELRLQEDSRINQAVSQIEIANAEGARQFEIDQLTTLLGVEGQRVAGARADIAGRRQMKGQMASGIGSMIGSLIAGS
tara:strand:+ start:1954 stop:2667 length:714 start_codon:yes stop_codon:yes gene_type:complete